MGDIINAGADLLGFGPASKQAKATTQAANISAQSTREALALQQRMYEEGIGRQKPFLEMGTNALNRLNALNQPGANAAQFLQMDPGYAFRLSEGQKQLDRMAAIRGGQISGSSLKAAARFGQEMGSQEYQNAFNRYQTERNARLNPLQSLAGFGQTSTNQLGAAGQAMASGVGEALGAGAQARASGYMGAANAITGGLGQYMNYQQSQAQNSLLQQALGRGSSSPSNADIERMYLGG